MAPVPVGVFLIFSLSQGEGLCLWPAGRGVSARSGRKTALAQSVLVFPAGSPPQLPAQKCREPPTPRWLEVPSWMPLPPGALTESHGLHVLFPVSGHAGCRVLGGWSGPCALTALGAGLGAVTSGPASPAVCQDSSASLQWAGPSLPKLTRNFEMGSFPRSIRQDLLGQGALLHGWRPPALGELQGHMNAHCTSELLAQGPKPRVAALSPQVPWR